MAVELGPQIADVGEVVRLAVAPVFLLSGVGVTLTLLVGRLALSSGAATVRTKGGKAVLMDGPYAETKEQVGGFYLIEAADRAAALAWAARCPAAGHGVVEVREVA